MYLRVATLRRLRHTGLEGEKGKENYVAIS